MASSNISQQASPGIGLEAESGLVNVSSPVGSESSGYAGGGLSPNSPAAASGVILPSPQASSSLSPAATTPAVLQATSPGQGLSAEALLAQSSPSAGAPVAPLLIAFTSEATVAPAEAEPVSVKTGGNASSPAAEAATSPAPSQTALECSTTPSSACASMPARPSSPSAQLSLTGTPPTTITPPTSHGNTTSSSALPLASQVMLLQTRAVQATHFASSPASLPPNPPSLTSPSPPLTSPHTYASSSHYGAVPLPGPDMAPASLLPYGIPLPMYAAFPAPASGPTTAPAPAPALAPGAALAPAAATAAEAAPSSVMLPRVMLASPAGRPPLPVAQLPTAQLQALAPATPSSGHTALAQTLAQGPNAAQLSVLPAVAGKASARADASVTPAPGDGGTGGGGLGAKNIGITAGAIAAGAVVLSKCRLPFH